MKRRTFAFMCVAALGAGSYRASAQCNFTVTSISPTVIGRTLNPATQYLNITGNVADGDAFQLDAAGSNRYYEFDTDNNVLAGSVPVHLAALDNITASRALAAAINGDSLAPFIAQAVPIGMTDQYLGLAWKTDAGYGATVAIPVNTSAHLVRGGATFNYNGNGKNFLQIFGANLNPGAPNITVKLVSTVDNTKSVAGTVTFRAADGSSLGFSVSFTQLGATPLPLGTYDVVLSRATTPTPCPDVTFPAAVTLVENLINDPTYIEGSLGNTISLIWQSMNFQLPPNWQNNNINDPVPTNPSGNYYEAARKGDKFFPVMADGMTTQCPRQYPFATAGNHTNNSGDNDWGSLRWYSGNAGFGIPDNNSGRHKMWQIIDINLATNSFLTLSGLWAGGTTLGSTLTYGIEIRDHGDPDNGAILAQTTPRTATDRFNWFSFSSILGMAAGSHHVALVVYGNNSPGSDAGLSVDDLLLRVGAKLWPDADNDGDVDGDDFGAFQRCYAGSGAPVLAGCAIYDRNSDGHVDDSDFAAFSLCLTGAAIPLDPSNVPAGCSL